MQEEVAVVVTLCVCVCVCVLERERQADRYKDRQKDRQTFGISSPCWRSFLSQSLLMWDPAAGAKLPS